MQTITHNPDNDTFVYRSGRYTETRENSPIFNAAYYIAKQYPEMTSRVWKAAVIFTDGLVSLVPSEKQTVHTYELFTATDTAVVRSKPTDPGYMIRRLHWRTDLAPGEPIPNHNHKFSCECYDYMEGKSPVIRGQAQCKHIMASRIALKKREEAAVKAELQQIVVTHPESDDQPPLDDPKTREIMVAAREKARRRRKGQLYEMVEAQLQQAHAHMHNHPEQFQ